MFFFCAGTPALTSRGFKEAEFVYVAELVDRAAEVVALAKTRVPSKKLKDFFATCSSDHQVSEQLAKLRADVNDFALKYPMPGFDDH